MVIVLTKKLHNNEQVSMQGFVITEDCTVNVKHFAFHNSQKPKFKGTKIHGNQNFQEPRFPGTKIQRSQNSIMIIKIPPLSK